MPNTWKATTVHKPRRLRRASAVAVRLRRTTDTTENENGMFSALTRLCIRFHCVT